MGLLSTVDLGYLAVFLRTPFEKLGLISESRYASFRSFCYIYSPPSSDAYPRTLEPGVGIPFGLTEKQGAALITKYRTHREDVELEPVFKAYVKRHYGSWVAFAHEAGHGDDIRPVLVTGVDVTRDSAMMAYSNNGVRLAS